METKKYARFNLEKKRTQYTQIGLVVSLALVLIAFEWRSYDANEFDFGGLVIEDVEEEIIPITEREIKPPPPPPPVEELLVVDDKEKMEDELEVVDKEVDEDTKVIEYQQEEEDLPDDVPVYWVEKMPKFGNGDADLLNYLAKNIRYPQMALESGISGIVHVKFVVDKKGKVGDVQILRGIGGGCDKEAIRVIESMPMWTPGKQNRKYVSVYYTVPVRFVLK